MTRYARIERAALADTLRDVGPDAPTLCEGWRARDLAAHVVIREREPLASAGLVVKALAPRTARRQAQVAAGDYPTLVTQIRTPPIWSTVSNPITDETFNLMEMYIHTEDVRRAQPGWKPRDLDPGLVDALWARCRGMARFGLRRFRATVTVDWPGHATVAAGAGGPEVTLRGEPTELILFLYGRQAVADVELDGPEEITGRLRRARLGT